MKNRSLFVLLAAVLPLFSCGTVGYSSLQGGGQFKNSIYYTPGSRSSAVQIAQQEEPAAVQQTQQGPASDTRTVYVGEANEVNINYEPGASYTIMDDDESYAARLRKFDSPTYTVNINLVEPYWWDVDMWWYGPRWHWYTPSWHWHSYWHNPWRSHWYSHWYGHWYDPWWSTPSWAWHSHWYDPWWGPVHRPIYAPWPGHGPARGPGYHPGHGRPGRNVYYGKRGSGSTYNGVNRGSVTAGKPGNVDSRNQQGSVTRRPSRNQQGNTGQQNGSVKPQQKSQQQGSQQNRSSYNRSSNSYNRSGSSYSGGSNRGSNSSGGATRSSGGGSSYRRR